MWDWGKCNRDSTTLHSHVSQVHWVFLSPVRQTVIVSLRIVSSSWLRLLVSSSPVGLLWKVRLSCDFFGTRCPEISMLTSGCVGFSHHWGKCVYIFVCGWTLCLSLLWKLIYRSGTRRAPIFCFPKNNTRATLEGLETLRGLNQLTGLSFPWRCLDFLDQPVLSSCHF